LPLTTDELGPIAQLLKVLTYCNIICEVPLVLKKPFGKTTSIFPTLSSLQPLTLEGEELHQNATRKMWESWLCKMPTLWMIVRRRSQEEERRPVRQTLKDYER